LGNRGNEVSIFAIILLSVALLFFPVQQGYGVSTPSPELNERQLIEFYELEQIVKAEQVRDENFVLQIKQNPYLDTLTNVIISFKENNEEQSPDRNDENFQLIKDEQISIAEKKYKEILGGKDISNSIYNEPINKKSIHKFKIDYQIGFMNKEMDCFENLILEQISLAENIRDEMPEFTANTINSNPYQNNESSLSDETNPCTPDETNPSTPDETNTSTPDETNTSTSDFLPNQILTFRHTFTNSEIKVKVETEKVQKLLDVVSTMNVSLVNQVGTDDTNIISPSNAFKRIFAMEMNSNNKENQILNVPMNNRQSEENKILNKPLNAMHNEENKILNIPLDYRQSDEFQNLILEQISLAENIRDEMPEFIANTINPNPYLNENIDESLDKTNKNNIPTHWSDTTYIYSELEFNILDRETKDFEMIKAAELEIAQNTLNEILLMTNSEEEDVEIIISNNENKEINNYNRDALNFEFYKNKQMVLAEKKLMEILGQKNIHNFQFLPTE
jgi:hypothetical protein